MDGLIILTLGFVNLACFLMGAKVGQAVSKGETVEVPTVNPMEIYRRNEAKREAKQEQERIDTIMRNIEQYDGTGRGQADVPGR